MNLGCAGRPLLVFVLSLACSGGAPGSSQRPADGAGATGTCEPGRCLEDIASHVKQHRKSARGCYDKGVERQAGISGVVIVNFEIGPDGRVVDASQSLRSGQLAEQEVIDCIVAVVKKIQFPPSRAGKTTRAYHTFEFSAR